MTYVVTFETGDCDYECVTVSASNTDITTMYARDKINELHSNRYFDYGDIVSVIRI